MRTNRVIAVLLVTVALGSLAGCGDKSAEEIQTGREVQATTVTVSPRELPVTVTAIGAVEPEVRVQVSTRMMGWVSQLHVHEGDIVTEGQALLTINDEDMQAKRAQVDAGIREAEAVVANSEKMAERFQNLFEAKAVSRQQLDDVLTGLERARAGLAGAEAAREEVSVHMSYLDIKAPIDGVVTRRMVEVGDMATPGHPLLFVDQLDRMKVVAHLGEKDISEVTEGDEVTVSVSSLENASYTVTVDRLIQAANPGSRTYDIEMYIDNDGRLRPGMFARIEFSTGVRNAVVIPATAVHERGQLTGVFIVDAAGEVHLRWIRLGATIGEDVEVISGLAGGETLVLSSEMPLAEGDKVVN